MSLRCLASLALEVEGVGGVPPEVEDVRLLRDGPIPPHPGHQWWGGVRHAVHHEQGQFSAVGPLGIWGESHESSVKIYQIYN